MAVRAPLVEITDLVRPLSVEGERVPVRVADLVARLRASGQRRAARIVARMPAHDGLLDPDAADAMAVRVHCEIQRLSEELQQPRRVAEHLRDLLPRLGPGPTTVVDVGCGIGYTLRWLADAGVLGDDVRLVGVDLDGTLVAHAERLARSEGLDVRFVHGDALAPGGVVDDPERTVVISSGLLHHLPDRADLERFFAAQAALGIAAFAHWDPVPGPWSVLGAQVFHWARMREPVSRQDGVVSVRRAHPAAVLEQVAAAAAPAYDVACAPDHPRRPAVVEVMRPVTGVRHEVAR